MVFAPFIVVNWCSCKLTVHFRARVRRRRRGGKGRRVRNPPATWQKPGSRNLLLPRKRKRIQRLKVWTGVRGPVLVPRVADLVPFRPDPDPANQKVKIRIRILLALTKNQ